MFRLPKPPLFYPHERHFFLEDLCSRAMVEEKDRGDLGASASASAAGTDADAEVELWASAGASPVFELATRAVLA